MNIKKLTPELEKARKKIERRALDLGLDFFDTVYYMANFEDMAQLISYSGFPKRYRHWSFGMNNIIYEHQYKTRMSKVFELVINTDYANAFLLDSNSDGINKMVMAHVYGHVDFFKNNVWFSKTNRKMIHEMGRHAEMVDRFIDKYGFDEVEKTIDMALTMENLIDEYSLFIKTDFETLEKKIRDNEKNIIIPEERDTGNPFIDRLFETEKKVRREILMYEEMEKRKKFPRKSQQDILKFIIDNALYSNPNLPQWKLEILNMVRDEAYYFVPQRMTKIMNEGWAVYWHTTLMSYPDLLDDSEFFEYSRLNSSVVGMGDRPTIRMNPYALGFALYKWIEEKWDKGRYGVDYEREKNMTKKMLWDKKEGKGLEKLFEVRKYYNDISFVTEFLDQEFCNKYKLFKYGQDSSGRIVIVSKDVNVIKKELISSLFNGGHPLIYLVDANYENRGALLLEHDFDFNYKSLDMGETVQVLRNLRYFWGKDVAIKSKEVISSKEGQFLIDFILEAKEDKLVIKSYDNEGEEYVQEVEYDEYFGKS